MRRFIPGTVVLLVGFVGFVSKTEIGLIIALICLIVGGFLLACGSLPQNLS